MHGRETEEGDIHCERLRLSYVLFSVHLQVRGAGLGPAAFVGGEKAHGAAWNITRHFPPPYGPLVHLRR